MTPPKSQREPNDRCRRTGQRPIEERYRRLYGELLEILIHLDPHSAHVLDRSPFSPEVASVLARLHEARVADDVERIVLEELRRWYGRRGLATVDRDRLADATIAICTVWNRFLANPRP